MVCRFPRWELEDARSNMAYFLEEAVFAFGIVSPAAQLPFDGSVVMLGRFTDSSETTGLGVRT